MSLDDAKWDVTLSLPKSHAPCYHHILLLWLMLYLHTSEERAKDSRPKEQIGLGPIVPKCSNLFY